MRHGGSRKRRSRVRFFLFLSAVFTGLGLLTLALRSLDPVSPDVDFPAQLKFSRSTSDLREDGVSSEAPKRGPKTCATVEEMGKAFRGGILKESLRVRRIFQRHFDLNGASRVRELPPEQFCGHGFVIGKASEAGFGNEMYKILTAAALSVMLNRSLIIGQTRHIIGSFSILSVLCFWSSCPFCHFETISLRYQSIVAFLYVCDGSCLSILCYPVMVNWELSFSICLYFTIQIA